MAGSCYLLGYRKTFARDGGNCVIPLGHWYTFSRNEDVPYNAPSEARTHTLYYSPVLHSCTLSYFTRSHNLYLHTTTITDPVLAI